MIRAHRNERGFTMVETLTSAAVLTIIVFAAVGASRAAMVTTGSVVSVETSDGRARNALDRLRSLLLSASGATLMAQPAVGGVVSELMQDGVDYADLNFRTVSGYANGGPVYVPAPNLPALHVYRAVDAQQRGSLVLDTGRNSTVLVDGVRSATFRKVGRQLHIDFVAESPDATGTSSSELELMLMVP